MSSEWLPELHPCGWGGGPQLSDGEERPVEKDNSDSPQKPEHGDRPDQTDKS